MTRRELTRHVIAIVPETGSTIACALCRATLHSQVCRYEETLRVMLMTRAWFGVAGLPYALILVSFITCGAEAGAADTADVMQDTAPVWGCGGCVPYARSDNIRIRVPPGLSGSRRVSFGIVSRCAV
jgi:hypothetical protein